MALGNASTHYDPASRQLLLWSIVLHNFPVSIALLGMLLQSGMPRSRARWLPGCICGHGAARDVSQCAHRPGVAQSRELMAFVIGIFMHISTTIFFESSDVHKFNFAKLGAIGVGTVLGIGIVLLQH